MSIYPTIWLQEHWEIQRKFYGYGGWVEGWVKCAAYYSEAIVLEHFDAMVKKQKRTRFRVLYTKTSIIADSESGI
jgi:hypothetical protein